MDNLKIDFNSSENQRIKGEFVNNNVLHCASSMMYELEEKECFQEEIMNLFYQYELNEESLIDEIQQGYKEELKEYQEENDIDEMKLEGLPTEDLKEIAESLGIDISNFEEPCEIFEYWIVNDWLGRKLKEYGQIVEDFLGFTIWGRCCTGQAILLDSVISHICNDLKLLK